METPRTFETRAERRARKRLERKQGPPPTKKGRWLWLLVLVLIGGGLWWWAGSKTSTPAKPKVVARADKKFLDQCTTDALTTFHIHPHLRIMIEGKDQPIPTDIGVTSNCLHPLHTHDGTGIIHVESPKKKDFSLGDFFYMWQKDYTATKILDKTVTADTQLKLFADKKDLTTGPDTIMKDKVSYVIMYGPAKTPLVPPDNYQFPKSL